MITAITPDLIHCTRRTGQMFAEEVKLHGGYKPEHFEEVWGSLMEQDLADLFVSAHEVDGTVMVHGFLCASYIPNLYNGLPSAQVQCWYVDPLHRKGSAAVRLFNAFEKESERRGIVNFTVGHKVGINEDAMRAFFIRRGFVCGECIYWKNA